MPILTKEEMERGRALQRRYEIIENHRLSLTHDSLGSKWKTASLAYQADPTDEALAAMKTALLERSLYRADTRARGQCTMALRNFSQTHVVPFFRSVIERLLPAAEAAATKVRAVEDARARRLIGRALVHSDITEAAELPVRQLRSLLDQALQHSYIGFRSPDSWMELLATIGSGDFERLIDDRVSQEEVASAVAEQEAAEQAASDDAAESEFPSELSGNSTAAS